MDVRRFGKWRWGDWGKDRSPDPVQEFDKFCDNIKNAYLKPIKARSFHSTTIGEMLLNQKYFNGIGNYLRAEILYEAKIHVSYFSSLKSLN